MDSWIHAFISLDTQTGPDLASEILFKFLSPSFFESFPISYHKKFQAHLDIFSAPALESLFLHGVLVPFGWE